MAPMAGLDEFDIIARHFAPLSAGAPGALSLTDDAALLTPAVGEQLVITADAVVAGVHYLHDDPPDLVARKLLRVNLSDLAGKGARPLAYVLCAAFARDTTDDWIAAFARGLAADQAEFGLSLMGGDTVATPGPATFSVTAFGSVAEGTAMRRDAAQVGDTIYVTGSLGDGALGLKVLTSPEELPGLDQAERNYLADRYRLPRPRLALGDSVRGIARAGMDVSDGLIADLGHICTRSGVGADVAADRLPLSAAAASVLAAQPGLMMAVLTGGDDYEVLFTAPSDAAAAVQARARDTDTAVTAIGRVVEGSQVTVRDASGKAVEAAKQGYRHFA